MKTKILITSFCLISILYSCVAPLPISKLTTKTQDSRWVSGRQYLQKESSGISINLSYYKNDDNLLIFDVLIDNYSGSNFEFNPTQVELTAMDANQKVISKVKAVDPEVMLTDFDKQESRAKADLTNDMTSNLFLASANLASTVIDETDSDLTEAERDRKFNQRLYWINDSQADVERQENYVESIRDTRLYWEKVPIRRTEIATMQYLDGRIFFERNTNAKYYKLVFHLPDGPLSFEFEQEAVEVIN